MLLSAQWLAGCGGAGESETPKAPEEAVSTSEPSVEELEGITADGLAEKLLAAYQGADRYVDNAEYHERVVHREDGVARVSPPHLVSVALERPAQLRITRNVPASDGGDFEVLYVSDGQRIRMSNTDYASELVDLPASAAIDRETLSVGARLRSMLLPVPMENLYPQLDLLLSSDDQPAQLLNEAELTLLPSESLEGEACYRLRIDRSAGTYVAWIDKEDFLLRRLDIPTDEVRRQLDPDGDLLRLEFWIDFQHASVDTRIGAQSFRLDPTDGVELVESFGANVEGQTEESVTQPASE